MREMNSKMNPISSLLQDIEIRYYWVMSRIVQSQRRNSLRIANINSASSDDHAITEKQNSIYSNSGQKMEYDKQVSAVV